MALFRMSFRIVREVEPASRGVVLRDVGAVSQIKPLRHLQTVDDVDLRGGYAARSTTLPAHDHEP